MSEDVQASGPKLEVWRPNAGPQTNFLCSSAYEALYGGAAGGGKSEGLLTDPLRYVHLPHFRAIAFRRTFPELEKSLIERSLPFYKRAFPAARYNDSKHIWRFPSGALIYFGHLEHDKSVFEHQSAEYQWIGFDELTSFTETQYTYMLSRLRSSHGYPLRARSATNPGGDGHEWVLRRWAPWLRINDSKYKGVRAAPREVLHYVNPDEGAEQYVPRGTPGALTRVFIPAKLADNPKIDKGYAGRLNGLDQVKRKQLRDGDWLIKPAAGLYFKRDWFRMVDSAPRENVRWIRYWDRAGTEKDPKKKNDPDWTVGVKLGITTGPGIPELYIDHVVRIRGTPATVEKLITDTASTDTPAIAVGIDQDPGQSGKFEAAYYLGRLQGWSVKGYPASADKVTRAGPISSQTEGGNVRMVRGGWNDDFLSVLEAFPEGTHDDDVDALSGAYAALVGTAVASYGDSPVVMGTWSSRRR